MSVCVCMCELFSMQSACTVLCSHMWPVWLYHIFQLYLRNGTISGRVTEHETLFDFPENFICSISHFKKDSLRYHKHKNVSVVLVRF